MIERIALKDATGFESLEWTDIAPINVVIGANDTGKTNLLRIPYAICRSISEHRLQEQSDVSTAFRDVLAERLRKTLLPRRMKLGDLTRKQGHRFEAECKFRNGNEVRFSFGSDAMSSMKAENVAEDLSANAPNPLFFPAKECLTVRDTIIDARDRLGYFDYGDDAYDLAKALRSRSSYADATDEYESVMYALEDLFQGHIEREQSELLYKKGREKYSMGQTAEGIKKVGALSQVMRARYIDKDSVLFFDEPEANLNPSVLLRYIEVLFKLPSIGVQLFIATHSYVVLKKLELLAREHDVAVPICVLRHDEDGAVESEISDLRDRIPPNPIVDASMELFNQDIKLSAQE